MINYSDFLAAMMSKRTWAEIAYEHPTRLPEAAVRCSTSVRSGDVTACQ